MASQKVIKAVTPAKAGVQKFLNFLDSRFHGNDREKAFRHPLTLTLSLKGEGLLSNSLRRPCSGFI